ncbi:MAG: LytR/AlgR family response regulator transcription factor [Eubacteriales bacterium]
MSDALKIAICEDESDQKNMLLQFLDESNIKNTSVVFANGEDLLTDFKQGKYDLILMDIYMEGKLTGIDTIRLIREKDKDVPVAFITTSKDYALESYRLSAIKYIEKPYSKESIEDIVHFAVLKKNDVPALFVQRNGIVERVPFANILYMEQQMHKVYLYLKNGEYFSVYGKLSELSEQLPQNIFFCPHKSFSVNLSYVMYIDMELRSFVMENKKIIPIRREFLTKAKKTLEDFLFDRTRRLLK